MKVNIACKCGFSLTPEMKHAFENGVCPNCGTKIEMGDMASANLLIDSIITLNLPLNAKQVKALLDDFLKGKLEMKLPELSLIDEPKDLVRAGTAKAQLAQKESAQPPTTNPQDGNPPAGAPEEPAAVEAVAVSEYEVTQIKTDLSSPPLVPMPDPKKYGSTKDGITFFNPQQFSRTPVLHTDVGHTVARPGDKQ